MLNREKKYMMGMIAALILCVVILLLRGKRVQEPGKDPFKVYSVDSRYLVISSGNFEGELSNLKKVYDGMYDIIDYSGSTDVQPVDWNEIGSIIFQNYNRYDGFVVLHGAETLCYTASGLSFILENLSKPVAVTTRAILGMKFITKYKIPEVIVVDGVNVIRGCRSKRYQGGFISPNFPVLGEKNVLNYNNVLQVPKESLKLLPINVNNRIVLIKMFPGMTDGYLENVLRGQKIYGIILESYDNGYISEDLKLLKLIEDIIKRGVIIVSVSQSSDTVIEGNGVIPGGSMTTEAAYAKLSLIVSHVRGYDNDMVTKLMGNNMRGEL
jgi:L-asparaginase